MIDETLEGHVVGLGGIFFKSKEGDKTLEWYRDTLGVKTDPYSALFTFREDDAPEKRGYNLIAPFKADTDYLKPTEKDFMINLRVRDLDGLVEKLKAKGVEFVDDVVKTPEGNFAWIIEPVNHIKIELWEQTGDAP